MNVYYAIEETIKVKSNVCLTWITITNICRRSRENQRSERKEKETKENHRNNTYLYMYTSRRAAKNRTKKKIENDNNRNRERNTEMIKLNVTTLQQSSKSISCLEAMEYDPIKNPFRCKQVCKKEKSCRKHRLVIFFD